MRGEARITLDGAGYDLRLTLGALAELEAGLQVESLGALVARFESGGASARDLVRLLGAGLRGAGAPISDERLAGMQVAGGATGAARAAAELLQNTFAPLGDMG